MLKVGLEGTSRSFELQSFGCCVLTVAVEGSGLRLRVSGYDTLRQASMRFITVPHPPPENNQKNEELPQQDVVTAQSRGKRTKRTLYTIYRIYKEYVGCTQYIDIGM